MAIKNDKKKLNKTNALINKHLCNFIADKFLRVTKNQEGKSISQNQYSDMVGLSSSTISKLKSLEGYNIPISTIYNNGRHEQYSLKVLLNYQQLKYGVDIPE